MAMYLVAFGISRIEFAPRTDGILQVHSFKVENKAVQMSDPPTPSDVQCVVDEAYYRYPSPAVDKHTKNRITHEIGLMFWSKFEP